MDRQIDQWNRIECSETDLACMKTWPLSDGTANEWWKINSSLNSTCGEKKTQLDIYLPAYTAKRPNLKSETLKFLEESIDLYNLRRERYLKVRNT